MTKKKKIALISFLKYSMIGIVAILVTFFREELRKVARLDRPTMVAGTSQPSSTPKTHDRSISRGGVENIPHVVNLPTPPIAPQLLKAEPRIAVYSHQKTHGPAESKMPKSKPYRIAGASSTPRRHRGNQIQPSAKWEFSGSVPDIDYDSNGIPSYSRSHSSPVSYTPPPSVLARLEALRNRTICRYPQKEEPPPTQEASLSVTVNVNGDNVYSYKH